MLSFIELLYRIRIGSMGA